MLLTGAPDYPAESATESRQCKLAAVEPGPWLRPATTDSPYRTRSTCEKAREGSRGRKEKTAQGKKAGACSFSGVLRGVLDHSRANTSVQGERHLNNTHNIGDPMAQLVWRWFCQR